VVDDKWSGMTECFMVVQFTSKIQEFNKRVTDNNFEHILEEILDLVSKVDAEDELETK
jgi:hypothetical protein